MLLKRPRLATRPEYYVGTNKGRQPAYHQQFSIGAIVGYQVLPPSATSLISWHRTFPWNHSNFQP